MSAAKTPLLTDQGEPMKTQTPLLDQLAKLDQELASAAARPREIQRQANAAANAAKQATADLVEAFASGDTKNEAKLTAAKTAAEAKANEPWSERIDGMKIAHARAESRRDAFIAENISGLLAELQPEAQAVAERLNAATAAIPQAHAAWHQMAQRITGLLRSTPTLNANDVPRITGIDALVRDIGRLEDAPAPIPAATRTSRIVPTSDPDPETRTAARADADLVFEQITATNN